MTEKDDQRRERYRELLEEFRVVIPGAQVLFAFLLTVPFAARFADVGTSGRHAFLVALLAAAFSIVLFLTPAPYHGVAPRRDRAARIRLSVQLALGGLALLAIAMTAGVFRDRRFVYDNSLGLVVGSALAVTMLVLWASVPLWRRHRRGDA